jgi:RNA polymerase sigma-70 factor (ECF subfamily)
MEPNATTELAVIGMGTSSAEIRRFDDVVQLYWARVFRFVLASVRDRETAEELTQDCFCKAYKGWRNFRGDASVITWLMHIAVNVVKDYARNQRLQFWRRARVVDPTGIGDCLADPNLSAEANVVMQEQIRAIWKAADLMSARQRTAFLLRFVEDMDLREIAEIMGVTDGAVKVHLFRAVQAVRKTLRIGNE